MDKIIIRGGKPLFGCIRIGGAKNAALPLMAACLLTSESIILENVPKLSDIITMAHLLVHHGVSLSLGGEEIFDSSGRVLFLRANNITDYEAPYNLVRKMRASALVLGPMLARFGYSKVSLPGGCAIGTRPLDIHLNALKDMGATIECKHGYIEASTDANGLRGAEINFDFPSVGATENILMAATIANGKTIINNAAREPEIVDLACLLRKMGAHIHGDGTNTITIEGVGSLHGARHSIIPDRIEAGTYAIAGAITGGEITLQNVESAAMLNVLDKLSECGVIVEVAPNEVRIKAGKAIKACNMITEAYPGFPTDMQAQLMALLTLSDGVSTIQENIFENRYMHVAELRRMGADIALSGDMAVIRGVKSLYGAELMATDLRASVSLILAGLAAEGETIINRVYHLDRGYESIEDKLTRCGADISRSF